MASTSEHSARRWLACAIAAALAGCGAPLSHAPATDHDAANPEAAPAQYTPPANPLQASAFEGEPEQADETGHAGHAGHAAPVERTSADHSGHAAGDDSR